MLNGLFKFLTPAFAKSSSSTPVSKKHLVLKTIYSTAGNPTLLNKPDVTINHIKKTLSNSDSVNHELLHKQKQILQRNPLFKEALIEITTLTADTVLVGLTKHPRPILGSVMMYSENVCHSDTWKTIENQASQQQAGIAVFKLSQPIACLKITSNKPSDAVSYLVYNRAIYLDKRLSQPIISNSSPKINKKF